MSQFRSTALDDLSGFLQARQASNDGVFVEPALEIPEMEPVDPPNDIPGSGLDWGELELMGGKVLVQFTPLGGTDSWTRLGRNGTCLREVKNLVDGMSLADLKRTIRTFLR